MAEELRLVGEFRDNITPKLKKLDREIKAVTQSFTKMQKKLRPIAKDMGTLAMASERVSNGLKAQRTGLESNIRALNQYKSAMGKAVSAQKKLKPTALPTPASPRGAAAPRGGGGGGIGMAGASALTGFAVAGQQIGTQIMMGLSRAFDMYKDILLKPFQFLMSGIQERIDDEMDDIKTAGGLFSISKRMEEPFIKNFAEAEALTKETNRYLAELAGSLPGDTQQYIQVSRQISDGIYQVLANDKEGSLALAQKIAEQNGRVLNLDSMNAAQQVQAAGKELVGEMTKLTVLGSLGQRQGAMGLPQLIEQMMSQEQVSSGQFKRYAAIFRDPLVKGALERNIPKINAAGKNTADRLEALKNTLDEVVTPDLVRRYQRSTAGVIEEMKTLFLNPEVGMLGLGRPLAKMAVVFNEFGQAVDKNGKVVTDLADAAREQISIFDYVRDIFANLAIVLGPIIKVATTLFMGFEDLADVLSKAREFTMKLQSNFEQYRVGLEAVAESLEGDAKTNFTSTISIRSALATVNNMLANFGVYGEEEFQKIGAQLKSPDFSDFPKMVMGLLDTFLKSDVAIKLGNSIGEVLGTVLKAFSDTILGITDASGVENLFSGFIKGFEGAGGIEAAEAILNKIVEVFGKALEFMVTKFPVKTFVAALILLAPAIVAGLVAALPGMLAGLAGAVGIGTGGVAAGAAGAGGAAVAGGGLLAALASPIGIAAGVALLAVAAKATEGMRTDFLEGKTDKDGKKVSTGLRDEAQRKTNEATNLVQAGDDMGGMLALIQGELMWVVHDFVKGFGDIFTGLYDFVVGLFTDPAMVSDGLLQILEGLWSLFTGIGHLIIGLLASIPVIVMGILTALKNLIFGVVQAIGTLGGMGLTWIGDQLGRAIKTLIDGVTGSIGNAWNNRPQWMGGTGGQTGEDTGSSSYNGNTSRTMGLGDAIATEQKNKPAGSHLVIANSSETVIPAFKGYIPKSAAIPAFSGYEPQKPMAAPAFKGYMGTEPAFAGTMASAPMTSNTSQDISVGDITVNVTGADNPTDIANQVADEILRAIQKSTYTEIYTT